MRQKLLVYVVAGTLVWSLVYLLVFVNRPNGSVRRTEETLNSLTEQLADLQNTLSQQNAENRRLLDALNKIADNRVAAAAPAGLVAPGAAGGATVAAPVIAVLVFACNRVTVSRHLDQVLRYRPDPARFPVIVSQDCGDRPTAEVIAGYGSAVKHIQQPDQSDIVLPAKEKKFKGYFKIARHYRWALSQAFDTFNHSTVLILEDDLDIAPDIFDYFTSTYPLLRDDPTLWCVSAWNDNGKLSRINASAAELLYRSDFFPGLGWMITDKLWHELRDKWPKSYWDDWMREPAQRLDRACIRPEVSRTRTFGKKGVSNGLFFEKHLKFIHLNDRPVPFTKMDMSYLLRENYDPWFVDHVYSCQEVTYTELKARQIGHKDCVRIQYVTKDGFKRTAKMLGLMDDLKSGVPRTGYRGVVSFMYEDRRVYLAPRPDWTKYDLTWS
ncbi:alpha-1,3-mannosyl-glycoprotein 2-beta-N-acetylglucosaminyltransferase-like isoform X1 [Amphibalanus amphitrite]|uniref:alpha-1,3-mannosyl-glycoprotein 2-beta-N-acetylglucosaminyltransferase-like isoform X1 n=1 Tax=Amphibalanus amphitrite TaxID=1232801 RepID=UPI001C9015B0|nr:alpha-1,3-mannosyl-glycoprotein 2-beta-N-acetylglucosaminyltransferase-like isoform X1 [Amphibalanus amphitrite]